MIPTFTGKINRRAYWRGLVFWVVADILFSIVIIGLVTLLQPDRDRTDSPLNTLGALLFIMGFLYAMLRLVSLIFERGNDIGKYGLLYSLLALIFTPMIVIIGCLPSGTPEED